MNKVILCIIIINEISHLSDIRGGDGFFAIKLIIV